MISTLASANWDTQKYFRSRIWKDQSNLVEILLLPSSDLFKKKILFECQLRGMSMQVLIETGRFLMMKKSKYSPFPSLCRSKDFAMSKPHAKLWCSTVNFSYLLQIAPMNTYSCRQEIGIVKLLVSDKLVIPEGIQ